MLGICPHCQALIREINLVSFSRTKTWLRVLPSAQIEVNHLDHDEPWTGKSVKMKPLTDTERRMCEVILAEIPEYFDPTWKRFIRKTYNHFNTAAIVITACLITHRIFGDLVQAPSLCMFPIAVVLSTCAFGIPCGWTSIVLSLGMIAYFFPPDGSFAIDREYLVRFVGMTMTLLAIMWMRPGAYDFVYYFISRNIRLIKDSINFTACSSSFDIGLPSTSRSTKVS